jgi:hypothetical protein
METYLKTVDSTISRAYLSPFTAPRIVIILLLLLSWFYIFSSRRRQKMVRDSYEPHILVLATDQTVALQLEDAIARQHGCEPVIPKFHTNGL